MMITTDRFFKLTAKRQVKFLTDKLANIDEVLEFVEKLARTGAHQKHNYLPGSSVKIDREVLQKTVSVWTSRLLLQEEIEEEYNYSDELATIARDTARQSRTDTLAKIMAAAAMPSFEEEKENKKLK